MSSIEKHHKKGGSKLGGGGEKVIYILSVFSGEKSEFAKTNESCLGICLSAQAAPYFFGRSWIREGMADHYAM